MEKKFFTKNNIISMCSYALVLIVVFMIGDLIEDIRTDGSAYELRYENDDTFNTAGKLYRLYIDGEYRADVDQNKYCLTDESGNTDYKYCTLIEDASRLTYTFILSAMIYIILMIAKDSMEGTPFNRKNIRLVKVISILQLMLAIVPGIVRMVLSFIRFNYYSSTFEIDSFYLFVIAFVISMIAHIFEKGLTLQEDVDSIA